MLIVMDEIVDLGRVFPSRFSGDVQHRFVVASCDVCSSRLEQSYGICVPRQNRRAIRAVGGSEPDAGVGGYGSGKQRLRVLAGAGAGNFRAGSWASQEI